MTTRQKEDARHAAAVRAYYATNDEALLGPVLLRVRLRLLGFLLGKGVQDTDLAEDLVQEALTVALTDLRQRKFTFAGTFTAWTVTICWHRFAEHMRSVKNKPSQPGAGEDPFQFLPASTATPAELLSVNAEDEARAGVVVAAATRAVLSLDPNARAVVVLHYYQGLSVEDAAHQLGIEVRKVKERLNRGIDTLRQWGSQHRHLAPTSDVYTALPRLDSGDLFQEHSLRLAS